MKRHRHLLHGAMASSLVGAICLLVTDIGGWTEQIVRYDPYNGTYDYSYTDYYVYFGSEDTPPSSSYVLVALVAAMAYSSVHALLAANGSLDAAARHTKHARLAAVGAAAGLMVLGMLFDLLLDDEQAYNSWLDTGYYGGLAGAALAATLLWVAARSVHPSGTPGTYTAPAQPHPSKPQHRAGWYPDPTGRHQHRWWDGQRWSADVADHGVTTSDPDLARQQPS